MNFINGQGIKMTKVLSNHTSTTTTVEAFEENVTGEYLFIDGKLAHVLNSKCTGTGIMALSKMQYFVHQVLCYQLISNS